MKPDRDNLPTTVDPRVLVHGRSGDDTRIAVAELALIGYGATVVACASLDDLWRRAERAHVGLVVLVAPADPAAGPSNDSIVDLPSRPPARGRPRPPLLVLGNRAVADQLAADAWLPERYHIDALVATTERLCPSGARTEEPLAPGTAAAEDDAYVDLIERLSDAVLIIDARTHQILDGNSRAAELYGYALDELRGMSHLVLIPRTQRPDVAEGAARLTRSGRATVVRRMHLRADGIEFPVSISASLTRFRSRAVFQDIVRDETQRWLTERDLEEKVRQRTAELARLNDRLKAEIDRRVEVEKELRTSKTRYLDLYDNAPDMFVSADARTGRIIECNATLASTLAVARRDLLGEPIVDTLFAQCRDRAVDMFERFAREGDIRDARLDLARTGAPALPVSVNVSAVRDAGGRILYSRCALRDESSRQSLERQVRESQRRDYLGTLATGLAHDVNNAMTAVLGFTEMIEQSALPADQVDAIAGIRSACAQAGALTRSLLGLARRSPDEARPLDVCGLVDSCYSILRSVLPSGVALSVDTPAAAVLWSRIERSSLQQVVNNLVLNARDALGERGRIRLGVERREAQGKAWVALCVEDDGKGMDDAIRAHLFDPFFTTKPEGKGAGLGLVVVQSIVDDHGGRIEVRTAPGEGTAITVWLPGCDPEPAPAVAASRSLAGAAGTGNVLLAEDDPRVRETIGLALRRIGYQPVLCADGGVASERFAVLGGQLEAVILDVDLPVRSGMECLREIRARDARLPVVLISGNAAPDTDGADTNHTAFISKPFEFNELAAKLSALRRARQVHDTTTVEARPSVLLVDDSAALRRSLALMLRRHGYAVTESKDGREALDMAIENRYDLVCADITMPRMSGLDLARALRDGAGATPAEVPIIAMGGNLDEQECRAAGMDDVLPKPFTGSALAAVLDRVGVGR